MTDTTNKLETITVKELQRIELRNAKLRELEQYILAEPRRFDMDSWYRTVSGLSGKDLQLNTPYIVEEQEPPCGTVACLAGNAVVMGGQYRFRAFLDEYGDSGQFVQKQSPSKRWRRIHVSVEELAIRILHLTEQEAAKLFYVPFLHGSSGWPASFNLAYKKEKDLAKRAQIAVDRIEHFIATEE